MRSLVVAAALTAATFAPPPWTRNNGPGATSSRMRRRQVMPVTRDINPDSVNEVTAIAGAGKSGTVGANAGSKTNPQ